MTSFSLRAADLNNRGAALLASGQSGQARATFGATLDIITQAVIQDGDGNRGDSSSSESSANFSNYEPLQSQLQAVPRLSQRAGTVPPKLRNGEPFIYNQALVFAPTIDINQCSLPFYTAVVLFNAALTFHLREGPPEAISLRLASNLYDMVLLNLKKNSASLRCANILVAALNNKAQILYQLKDYEAAGRLWSDVWANIFDTEKRPCFDQSELDGFLYNILCLLNEPLHASSA